MASVPQFRLGFDKQRSEGSVQMVANRHRRSALREAKLRDVLIDIVDDSFVFFWFNAAGAVYETAAGLQVPNRSFDNSGLKILHPRKVLRSQAPSHICASTDDSGIGTRSIDKDRIERFRFERGSVLKPIHQNNIAIANP